MTISMIDFGKSTFLPIPMKIWETTTFVIFLFSIIPKLSVVYLKSNIGCLKNDDHCCITCVVIQENHTIPSVVLKLLSSPFLKGILSFSMTNHTLGNVQIRTATEKQVSSALRWQNNLWSTMVPLLYMKCLSASLVVSQLTWN